MADIDSFAEGIGATTFLPGMDHSSTDRGAERPRARAHRFMLSS